MQKKKFVGSFCAVLMGLSFAATCQAADMSVAKQEAQAQRWIEEKLPQRNDAKSELAQSFTPIIQDLQKRICDANGIEITTMPFQNDDDYLTKVHPMEVVDDYYNATAMGAGYSFMGVPSITQDAFAARYTKFSSFVDYVTVEKDIAHEMAHNLKGHTLKGMSLYIKELEAEKGAFAYMNNLPEGGWGSYYVACSRFMNRPEQNMEVFKETLKQTKDCVTIDADSAYNVAIYYTDVAGMEHELTNAASPFFTDRDEGIFYGGQLAETVAKKALTLDSIQLRENTFSKLKLYGNMLVCASPNLPNGYRVLSGTTVTPDELEMIKSLVRSGTVTLPMYDTDVNEMGISSASQALEQNLPGYDNDPRKYWRTWLTCAIAYDAEQQNL